MATACAILLTAGATLAIEELPIGFGVGTSASYTAEATIGGTTIGVASSANYTASAGFVAISPANAPSGLVQVLTVAQNTNATVRARLQDDVQVVSATLNYRVGGASAYTQIPMALTDAGAGEWSAVIPAGDVTARGVQYYVDASDGVNVASIWPTRW
jgi:hypothetical protein